MYYNSKNLQHAKDMRSNQTPFEHILWEVLRANKFENLKFKRQVLIGNYIADFVCEVKKLIIELDGSQHGDNQIISYDNARTKYFNACGYNVLRFWNNDVLNNLEGVCEVIRNNI